MRKNIRSMTVRVLLGFVVVIVFSQWTANSATKDDDVAIRKVVDGFTGDFNSHNAQGVATWFSEDADFINVRQELTHGRQAIAEHFVPLFAGALKNSHRTYKVRGIRFIRPDVASVELDYELTGATTPNGATSAPRHGLYDWILTKKNGKWNINVLHESELGTS